MKYKILCLLGLFIFLLVSVSAASLATSAGYLIFDTKAGEQSCKDFTILKSSYNSLDFSMWGWNNEGDNSWRLSNMKQTSEVRGIKVILPEPITLNGSRKTVQICVTPEKQGTYQGAFIIKNYNPEVQLKGISQVIQFGIWLKVNAR